MALGAGVDKTLGEGEIQKMQQEGGKGGETLPATRSVFSGATLIHTHIHAHVHTYTHARAHTHIRKRTHTHTHTHTCTL